jgi:hypothetical protein
MGMGIDEVQGWPFSIFSQRYVIISKMNEAGQGNFKELDPGSTCELF